MNVFRNSAFSQSNAVLDEADRQEPTVELEGTVSAEYLEQLKPYFDGVLEAAYTVELTYFCWFNFVLHFAL